MKTIYSNDLETSYTSYEFSIKNTIYSVIVVKGNSNYINVKKVTANPWNSTGKYFNSFDAAVQNYSNAQIKTELLKIELGL
jgi:hypothetical protein